MHDCGKSISMETERRNEGNQLPECLDEVLTRMQLLALSKLGQFGWVVAFIRRPLFQEIVPVLLHPDNNTLGILDNDGALNTQPEIEFR